MGNTITIRLTDDTLTWLRETSRRTGIPVGQLVREGLDSMRERRGKQRFMRHAGTISGPPDLSSRKGYSRK